MDPHGDPLAPSLSGLIGTHSLWSVSPFSSSCISRASQRDPAQRGFFFVFFSFFFRSPSSISACDSGRGVFDIERPFQDRHSIKHTRTRTKTHTHTMFRATMPADDKGLTCGYSQSRTLKILYQSRRTDPITALHSRLSPVSHHDITEEELITRHDHLAGAQTYIHARAFTQNLKTG